MSAPGTYHRAFPNADLPYISYGMPFLEICTYHVVNTFKVERVYIIASKTLSTSTNALKRLRDALGTKVAGVRIGMKSHTYWSEILDVTEACRRSKADLIITLGAGSLTDAAKIVSLVC